MWERAVWTKEDYKDFVDYLKELQDMDYRVFHSNLLPGIERLIGIRTPKMREIAKQIAQGDFESFLQQSNADYEKGDFYYEQAVIEGMVIGYCSGKKIKDILQVKAYITDFAPKIDNWATCDIFCSGIKIIGKHPQEFWNFLLLFVETGEEFKVRMGIVCLMNYYLKEEYVDEVLMICDKVQSDAYYIKMAIAWLISVAYVKFKDKTMQYLNNNQLSKFTYNKALQKITESYRVSADEKKIIRSMRKV